MKLIRTQGRGARDAAALLAQLGKRGGAALDSVMPAVQRIVADVRRDGDRAMFRYAGKFDGLTDRTQFRVTQQEMAEAWVATDPPLPECCGTRRCDGLPQWRSEGVAHLSSRFRQLSRDTRWRHSHERDSV